MPFTSISIYGLCSKVLLKQIYQNVGLFVNSHSEEACLLVAFYHEFKHFVQFFVNGLTEYFLQFILLRELNTMRLSVCKITTKQCLLGCKSS